MNGWKVCAFALSSVSIAYAQVPNAAVRVDLFPSYISETGSKNRIRWYDPMARVSTVGMGLNLEPGYYVLITERLQRISGDLDKQQLDEFYVEEPGFWRVGRQYIPFGRQNLVRQASTAVRTSQLPFLKKAIPIQLAFVHDGGKQARGLVGRLGTKVVGVSLAYGDHFLLPSTNLAQFSDFENKDPNRKGYKLMVGLDLTRKWGQLELAAEYLGLRRGESLAERARDITDFTVTARPDNKTKLTAGWVRDYKQGIDLYRFESEIIANRNVAIRSFVRFDRGAWKDLSVGVRIRF